MRLAVTPGAGSEEAAAIAAAVQAALFGQAPPPAEPAIPAWRHAGLLEGVARPIQPAPARSAWPA